MLKLSHKEMRKQQKKLRRKKIRQKIAKSRIVEIISSEVLEKCLEKEQEAEKERKWNQIQWEDRERISQLEFSQQKCQIEQDQFKVLEAERKMKESHELKAAQKKKSIDKYQKLIAGMEEQRQRIFDQVQSYILGFSELPDEVKNTIASNPQREICSIYQRTSCCQYGDRCSRNHLKPVISRILLIQNFFSHILLDNETNTVEQMEELSSSFQDFYVDIYAELEKFGEIENISVCCNKIQHLKGNVYVEFKDQKNAIIAFQKLYGRFYDGKILIVEFASILSWSAALCDSDFNGNCMNVLCMYLHVFKNPNNCLLVSKCGRPQLQQYSQTSSPKFLERALPEFISEPASKRNMKLCSTVRSIKKSPKRRIYKVERKSKKDVEYLSSRKSKKKSSHKSKRRAKS